MREIVALGMGVLWGAGKTEGWEVTRDILGAGTVLGALPVCLLLSFYGYGRLNNGPP